MLLFFWLMFARVFSMMPWAASISYLREANNGNLDLGVLPGVGHRYPFASGILIIGGLSLAGIPLLAGFSARFAFWRAISGSAPLLSLLALLGNAGLVIASLRVIFSLFISFPDQALEDAGEKPGIAAFSWLLVGLFGIFLAVVGFFPQLYLPSLEKLLFIFERLGA